MKRRGEKTWSDLNRPKPKPWRKILACILIFLGAWIGVYAMNVTGYELCGLIPVLVWGIIVVHLLIKPLF